MGDENVFRTYVIARGQTCPTCGEDLQYLLGMYPACDPGDRVFFITGDPFCMDCDQEAFHACQEWEYPKDADYRSIHMLYPEELRDLIEGIWEKLSMEIWGRFGVLLDKAVEETLEKADREVEDVMKKLNVKDLLS